jgi:predicted ABC-type ATPase
VSLTYPRASKVIAVSGGVADDLAQNFGVPRKKLVSIANPIDVDAIEAKGEAEPSYKPDGDYILAAGRLVLERLDQLFALRADVVLETTLATRSHAVRIRDWKAAGYRVELIYLRLPSADHSVARVARRVSEGGHGIPEDTLRRRFLLSLAYLETTYKPLADDWKVYASGGEVLELLDWGPR